MINDDIIQSSLVDELLGNLSESEKMMVMSKLIGYPKLPPDIKTILYDDYYLGHIGNALYPCWKEWLEDFYYNPIQSKSTIVVLTGALGIGKSYVAMLILLVDLIRLSFHPDPFKFLGLNKLSSPSFLRFFNKDKNKAYSVLLTPFINLLEGSPYLIERRKNTDEHYPHNMNLGVARSSLDVISEVLFGVILSEFNFIKNPWIAEDMLSTCLNRMRGRLLKSIQFHLWSHVIIDSSASTENSTLNNFMKNNSWSEDTIYATKSIWEAKSHLGIFFKKGSFRVYLGDNGRDPFIIPEEGFDIEANKLDKDRILIAPEELRPDFSLDIVKSLNDLAGVSTSTGDKFFTEKQKLMEVFNLKNPINESYIVDFFDDEDLWSIVGNQILSVIPEDRYVYGRIDLGLVNDATGIALCYGDKAVYKNIEGKRVFEGYYNLPIIFQVSRIAGQETNIDKIVNFFIALNQHRQIKLVTTDQFQSSNARQKLMLNDIPTQLYSVDRTAEAYIVGKDLIYKKRANFVDNEVTKLEARELIYFDGKVDHPSGGSKDTCDAAFGALYTCFRDQEEAFAQVEKTKLDNYGSLLKGLAKKNSNRFNSLNSAWR